MTSRPDDPSSSPELPPQLQSWLEECPCEERREMKKAWELAGLAEKPGPDAKATDAAWEEVAGTLGSPELPASAPRATDRAPDRRRRTVGRRSRRTWRRSIALAAAAFALAAIGLWLWTRPVTITAPAGTTKTVRLPDGSRAVLNSVSSLTYQRSIPLLKEWNRDVELDGEALFDVNPGAKTFVVTTFNARTKVLGTRFNVRARSDGGTPVTSVTLAEGALKFAGSGGRRKSVTLAPGQWSRVTGANGVPTSPAPADVEAALTWRGGGFSFNEVPVSAIARELERRFAIEIRVASSLRHDTLSLHLPEAAGPAVVLSDICAAGSCRTRRTAEGNFVLE